MDTLEIMELRMKIKCEMSDRGDKCVDLIPDIRHWKTNLKKMTFQRTFISFTYLYEIIVSFYLCIVNTISKPKQH